MATLHSGSRVPGRSSRRAAPPRWPPSSRASCSWPWSGLLRRARRDRPGWSWRSRASSSGRRSTRTRRTVPTPTPSWRCPAGCRAPGFRLWATRSGSAFGVYGGWGGGTRPTTRPIATERAKSALPEGYQFFRSAPQVGGPAGPVDDGPTGARCSPGRGGSGTSCRAGWSSRTSPRHAERLTPVLRRHGREETATGGQRRRRASDDLQGCAGPVQGRAALSERQGPVARGAACAVRRGPLSGEPLRLRPRPLSLAGQRQALRQPRPAVGAQHQPRRDGLDRARRLRGQAAGDPVGRGRRRDQDRPRRSTGTTSAPRDWARACCSSSSPSPTRGASFRRSR